MGASSSRDALPAYMRIRRRVLGQIARSAGVNGFEKIASIQQLCELYKVSQPTVIKALRELREEGYLISRNGLGMFINPNKASALASEIAARRGRVIGLIIGGGMHVHYDAIYLKIIAGVTEALADANYIAQLVSASLDEKETVNEILSYQLDALIWINPWGEHRLSILRALEAAGLPVVGVPLYASGWTRNSVGVNFHGLGYAAAAYLLKSGHRDIVAISSDPEAPRQSFFKGLETAFSENGLDRDERLNVTPDGDLASRLETLIDLKTPFTAIMTTSARYREVMDVLAKKGVRVPADCSVLVEGDNATNYLKDPAPTRVVRPLKELGERAVSALGDILTGKNAGPVDITLPWSVVEGETCRPVIEGADVRSGRR